MDKLRLEYVPLSTAVKWDWIENAKLHDTGGIIQSIQEYGFRSPPELDSALADGGAFAQGSGRVKALALMQLDGRCQLLPAKAGSLAETGRPIIVD